MRSEKLIDRVVNHVDRITKGISAREGTAGARTRSTHRKGRKYNEQPDRTADGQLWRKKEKSSLEIRIAAGTDQSAHLQHP